MVQRFYWGINAMACVLIPTENFICKANVMTWTHPFFNIKVCAVAVPGSSHLRAPIFFIASRRFSVQLFLLSSEQGSKMSRWRSLETSILGGCLGAGAGGAGIQMTCWIFLPTFDRSSTVNPVNQRLIAALQGDGLAWAYPESLEEGLHVIAGGSCPGVFKMHHFIS